MKNGGGGGGRGKQQNDYGDRSYSQQPQSYGGPQGGQQPQHGQPPVAADGSDPYAACKLNLHRLMHKSSSNQYQMVDTRHTSPSGTKSWPPSNKEADKVVRTHHQERLELARDTRHRLMMCRHRLDCIA